MFLRWMFTLTIIVSLFLHKLNAAYLQQLQQQDLDSNSDEIQETIDEIARDLDEHELFKRNRYPNFHLSPLWLSRRTRSNRLYGKPLWISRQGR